MNEDTSYINGITLTQEYQGHHYTEIRTKNGKTFHIRKKERRDLTYLNNKAFFDFFVPMLKISQVLYEHIISKLSGSYKAIEIALKQHTASKIAFKNIATIASSTADPLTTEEQNFVYDRIIER